MNVSFQPWRSGKAPPLPTATCSRTRQMHLHLACPSKVSSKWSLHWARRLRMDRTSAGSYVSAKATGPPTTPAASARQRSPGVIVRTDRNGSRTTYGRPLRLSHSNSRIPDLILGRGLDSHARDQTHWGAGKGDSPSSARNALCFAVASRIWHSTPTSSLCVAERSISTSGSAVLT